MAKDNKGSSKHFITSVILHVVFFATLVTSLSFSTEKPPIQINLAKDPKIVKAKLIDNRAADLQVQKQIAAERQLLEQQRAQQQQVEEQAKLAQEKAVKEKLAQEKAVKEKLAQEKAVQDKLAQEKLAQQKTAQQKAKIEKEQLAKKQAVAKAETAKKEAAKKEMAKQEAAKKEIAKQEAVAAKKAADAKATAARQAAALKAEHDLINAKHAEHIATEIDRYRAEIQAMIEENRILSSVFTGNITCKVRIKLLPDGSIQSVNIVEASGNPAYDEMATAAVYKSAPFPMPEEQEIYNQLRDVVLSFKNGEESDDVY